MENIGENIVGEYLREIKKCDFVQYNIQIKSKQGEIDVVAINLDKKEVYICEVATHLETGLQYTKGNKPDNVNRFIRKFNKNIEYSEEYFKDYQCYFMLWSPIIKIPKKEGAINNQLRDLHEIKERIRREHNIETELVCNQDYLNVINELRRKAKETTYAMTSSVMRFLQIEEKLKVHLKKIKE